MMNTILPVRGRDGQPDKPNKSLVQRVIGRLVKENMVAKKGPKLRPHKARQGRRRSPEMTDTRGQPPNAASRRRSATAVRVAAAKSANYTVPMGSHFSRVFCMAPCRAMRAGRLVRSWAQRWGRLPIRRDSIGGKWLELLKPIAQRDAREVLRQHPELRLV
jgi:hypothetical protein